MTVRVYFDQPDVSLLDRWIGSGWYANVEGAGGRYLASGLGFADAGSSTVSALLQKLLPVLAEGGRVGRIGVLVARTTDTQAVLDNAAEREISPIGSTPWGDDTTAFVFKNTLEFRRMVSYTDWNALMEVPSVFFLSDYGLTVTGAGGGEDTLPEVPSEIVLSDVGMHDYGYLIYSVRITEEYAATLGRLASYMYDTIDVARSNHDARGPWFVEGEPDSVRGGVLQEVDAQVNRRQAWKVYLEQGKSLEAMLEGARIAWREELRSGWNARIKQAEIAEEARRREHREKTQRNLEAYLEKRRAEVSQDEVIPNLPFMPHGFASSRRWGIEVESGGARGVEAPDGWDRKGDGSLRSAWRGFVEVQDFEPYDEEVTETISPAQCEKWETHVISTWAEVDGDMVQTPNPEYVNPQDCDACGVRTHTVRVEPQTVTHTERHDDCAEFVSPILVSVHSRGLEQLTAELAKQPQNDTAGVHVHVEANDLTDKQLATLVYGYNMLEPMFEKSYRRGRRDYCRALPVRSIINYSRQSNGGGLDRGERYVAVNLLALNAHGTVEFRAMGPVYDYKHLSRWAMFCREMVNIVKNGATVRDFSKIGNWEGVLKLMLKYGREYPRAVVYSETGMTEEWPSLAKVGDNPSREQAAAQAALDLSDYVQNDEVPEWERQLLRELAESDLVAVTMAHEV